MKIFNGIAIALLLLMSVFAGAAALEVYQQPVSVYDTNNNMLTADSIKVVDSAGNEIGTGVTNAQKYTFLLNVGSYTITAKKTGYATADAQVKIESGSPSPMPTISLKLQAQVPPPPASGGSGSTGGDTTGTQSNDVTIKDVDFDEKVSPGQSVDFKVEVQNPEATKYDAEDVEVTVTINDIDDGDDVDESTALGTIDSDSKETATVAVMIPKKVDAGKYKVDIKVEWVEKKADGSEVDHFTTKVSEIEVVKETHDVEITAAALASGTMEPGRSGQVAVSLFNAGKNDETSRIKVESADLKISAMSAQFKLNEGDETTQYVPFSVPGDAKAGKYFVYVTVYFNAGTQSNLEMLTLEVKSPTAATGTQQQVAITPVVVTTATSTPGKPGLGSFGGAGMVLAVLVLLAVIGMLAKDFAPEFGAKPQIIKAKR